MIFWQEVGYCHNKTRKIVQWPEYDFIKHTYSTCLVCKIVGTKSM